MMVMLVNSRLGPQLSGPGLEIELTLSSDSGVNVGALLVDLDGGDITPQQRKEECLIWRL